MTDISCGVVYKATLASLVLFRTEATVMCKDLFYSDSQDPSLTMNINGLINECQEAEDFLWTLVFNVIQDELKFKQSPFFKNCNASNGLGPMPSLGPMAPPSGLLPMPPPPPPPGLAPFMHQIQNGQRKMYRNESPQMRQPYGPGPKQQETPMQYRGNWFGEMQ